MTTDDYPSQGERDDILADKKSAAELRAEQCQAAPFNIGPGGVAAFAEQVEVANELAVVQSGNRRRVSGVPLLEVDESGFTPDKSMRLQALRALVIDGDDMYAISSLRTTDGVRVALRRVGYGGLNTDYSDQPSHELLGSMDVKPASSGELPDPENKDTMRVGGFRVDYDEGGIFVGADPGQGNDRPITLVDRSAGLADTDKLAARDAYVQLLEKLGPNGLGSMLWKP